jgi:hypothetical protein
LASMGRASTALVVRSGCALPAVSGSLPSPLLPRIIELVLAVVLDSVLIFTILTVAVGLVLAAGTLWGVARGRVALLEVDHVAAPLTVRDFLRVSKVGHLQVKCPEKGDEPGSPNSLALAKMISSDTGFSA